MQAIKHLLGANIRKDLENSPSEPQGYNCSICKRFVKPLEVDLLGRKKLVQPKCKCEVDRLMSEIHESEERHRQDLIRQMFPVDKIGERFDNCRFETYDWRPGNDKVFEKARKYVERFEEWREISLYIWGSPGNGKTHLAAAITHELNVRGKIVVFQSVPELLNRIKKTFNSKSRESETQIIDALMRCHLLVLDDIGSEKVTDWVAEELFRIIDGRYQAKKPILFTSNLSILQLANRFDETQGMRIADRITEITIQVQNESSSYRLETAEKRLELIRRRDSGE